MPPKKRKEPKLPPALAGLQMGPQWSDISDSEIDPLPLLPKSVPLNNPRFLARSHHSHVYTIDLTHQNIATRVILKLFPKALKHRYIKEVDAYRYLYHYGVPGEGVVPNVYGVLPSISKKRLDQILGNSIPDDAPITTPASGLFMQYFEGAVNPSSENITPELAKAAVRALQLIHSSHVLHGDAEGRNLLMYPGLGRIVWIDFSSASINRSMRRATQELDPVRNFLYNTLVSPGMFIC
jgi:tRNA A-37 threonylcarbamoyl transferase component Bud32